MNILFRRIMLVILIGSIGSSTYAVDTVPATPQGSSISGLAEEVQKYATEHPYMAAGVLLFSGFVVIGIIEKWMKSYKGKDGKKLKGDALEAKQEHEARHAAKKGIKGFAKVTAWFKNIFATPGQKIDDGVEYFKKCQKRYEEGRPERTEAA